MEADNMAKNTYDLNRIITIQNNAAEGTTDANGNPAFNWINLCTVYAQKLGLKGRLFYDAAAAQEEDDVMFTIYFRYGIRSTMRLIDTTDINGVATANAQTYELKVPPTDPDGTRKYLELHCREVFENGG